MLRGTEAMVAAGFVVVIAGCFLALAVPDGLTGPRAAVLAVVVGAFAAAARDLLAALATAGMAWLFCNGFLVNRLGELRWHGRVDAVRLGVFGAAAVLGTGLGWLARAVGSARRWWSAVPPPAEAAQTPEAGEPPPLPPGVPASWRVGPRAGPYRG